MQPSTLLLSLVCLSAPLVSAAPPKIPGLPKSPVPSLTSVLNGILHPKPTLPATGPNNGEGPEDGQTHCSVYQSNQDCSAYKNCYCGQTAGGPAIQCVQYGPSQGACNTSSDPDFCPQGQQCIINENGGYQCALLCH